MSTRTFEANLKKINRQFKAAKLGVSIRQRKNSLYIRATLPPKPTSTKTKDHQQDIPTGYKALKAGLEEAEKMAKEVAGKIAGKTFDWVDYGVEPPKDDCDRTIAEWIAAFEQDYFERKKRTATSELSFDTHYVQYFKRLPQSAHLSAEILREAIVKTEPDSASRLEACIAFKKLGEFAQVEVAFISGLRGSYNSLKPAPRNLPSDEQIVKAISEIPNPAWQWVFGMIATYGLRPHEAFRIETFEFPNITLSEHTKTGRRTVRPLRPEWVELFDLSNIRYPKVKVTPERPNRKIGRSTSTAARRYGLPFRAYDLRHRWAVRAIEYQIPTSLAAKWMGHDVQMHTKVYEAWMQVETEDAIYLRALQTIKLHGNDQDAAPPSADATASERQAPPEDTLCAEPAESAHATENQAAASAVVPDSPHSDADLEVTESTFDEATESATEPGNDAGWAKTLDGGTGPVEAKDLDRSQPLEADGALDNVTDCIEPIAVDLVGHKDEALTGEPHLSEEEVTQERTVDNEDDVLTLSSAVSLESESGSQSA